MVRLCVALLGRLQHEPRSLYRANQLGGPEHFGWGPAEYQLANLSDQVQANTIATIKAAGSKKRMSLDPAYRPPLKRERAPRSLADVDYSFFN